MDLSHLEKKYFLDDKRYNCPFCNCRSVTYTVTGKGKTDWSKEREVFVYFVKCGNTDCAKTSLHLSNLDWKIFGYNSAAYGFTYEPENLPEDQEYEKEQLDKLFFYHRPTSFFTVDARIPSAIRELISEAQGCSEMGYMVGASGALRKAIYEFLKDQAAVGENYEDRIKALKLKYPSAPTEYFDALSNIQGMTSEGLHEQEGSWEPWEKNDFDFLVSATKAALREVYVVPEERKATLTEVLGIRKAKKS